MMKNKDLSSIPKTYLSSNRRILDEISNLLHLRTGKNHRIALNFNLVAGQFHHSWPLFATVKIIGVTHLGIASIPECTIGAEVKLNLQVIVILFVLILVI